MGGYCNCNMYGRRVRRPVMLKKAGALDLTPTAPATPATAKAPATPAPSSTAEEHCAPSYGKLPQNEAHFILCGA